MADPQAQPVTAPVTPEPLPETFTVHHVAALTRDLAMALVDERDILKAHKLTPGHLETLKKNKFFIDSLAQSIIDWHKPSNVQRRLAMGAGIILEMGMPVLGTRMMNTQEPLANAVQAFAAIAKVAGVGEQSAAKSLSEKVTITINLGADQERIEATRTIEVRPEPEGTSAPAALREGTNRESQTGPIPQEPVPLALPVPVRSQSEGPTEAAALQPQRREDYAGPPLLEKET